MIDYAEICRLSEALGRKRTSLIALMSENDPFDADRPERRRRAEWVAGLFNRLGFSRGVHLRRIHYRLVSQETPVMGLDGLPYENTEKCWKHLCNCLKDARYLGLIAPADIVDSRSDEPLVKLPEDGREASVVTADSVPDIEGRCDQYGLSEFDDDMPDLPGICLIPPVIAQPYAVEIWIEKSTMNDILLPIAERHNVTLVVGLGELSATRCYECVQRMAGHGRKTRILYISDFDPGGDCMPVSVARKIEFFLRQGGHDGLDVQVIPIALTAEQCRSYEPNLPRTPIKDTERRKTNFERRHGEGATELDALEATRPGEFRRIVEEAIARFHDSTLAGRVRAKAQEVQDEIDAIGEAVHEAYADEIAEIESDWEAVVAEIAEHREEIGRLNQAIDDSLERWRARAEPSCRAMTSDLEAQKPDLAAVEWPEAEPADEFDDPLFDSSRAYVEQVDRYREHKGK